MPEKDLEKLGKIVQLAKHGQDGEKEVAIRLVQKLCKQWDLDFESVMTDIQIEEFVIECKRGEYKLLSHVLGRYYLTSMEDTWMTNPGKTRAKIKTTKERYIEILNAFEILRRLYKKEQAKMREATQYAFLMKHQLFYTPTQEEMAKRKPEEPKLEDLQKALLARKLTGDMEDANILKTLPGA